MLSMLFTATDTPTEAPRVPKVSAPDPTSESIVEASVAATMTSETAVTFFGPSI